MLTEDFVALSNYFSNIIHLEQLLNVSASKYITQNI